MRKQQKQLPCPRGVLGPSGPRQVVYGKDPPITDADFSQRRIGKAVELCRKLNAGHLFVSGNVTEMDWLELVTLEAIRAVGYRPYSVDYQHAGTDVPMNTFMNVFLACRAAHAWKLEEIVMVPSFFQEKRMGFVADGLRSLMRQHLDWDVRIRSVPCPPSTNEIVVEFEAALAGQEEMKLEFERGTLSGFAAELRSWRRRRQEFLPIPQSLYRSVPQTLTRIEQTVSAKSS